MRHTLFAGLTQLDPLDPLSTDEYSFQAVNPDIIDRLLEVGAVTHRHDGHPALADPTTPPSCASGAGGQIPGGVTFEFAYTLIDADRGETLPSPVCTVTTQDIIAAPAIAPVGVANYAAGVLAGDAYYYAETWVDADGGETTLGAIEAVDVDPAPTAQVLLSGLAAGMPAGAVAWRLYRARGGENFHYIATGSGNTLTDDGTLCANCQVFPPAVNTTQRSASLEVTIPSIPSGAVGGWRLYGRAQSGAWPANSYMASGTAGGLQTFNVFAPTYGRPPLRSLALRGAHMIDPDTELLDWHWKTPVQDVGSLPPTGNASGDVRLSLDERRLNLWILEEWLPFIPPGRIGHTFSIMGDIPTGSGIPGFWVALHPDVEGNLARVQHKTIAGSATVSLWRSGIPLLDYQHMTADTDVEAVDGEDLLLNGHFVQLFVESVAGGAAGLSLTLFIDTGPPPP